MTLREMAGDYRVSAAMLSDRLRLLRRAARGSQDPDEIWHLRQRIYRLTEMLTQMNELAELTEHYYERNFHRNEKYRL